MSELKPGTGRVFQDSDEIPALHLNLHDKRAMASALGLLHCDWEHVETGKKWWQFWKRRYRLQYREWIEGESK